MERDPDRSITEPPHEQIDSPQSRCQVCGGHVCFVWQQVTFDRLCRLIAKIGFVAPVMPAFWGNQSLESWFLVWAALLASAYILRSEPVLRCDKCSHWIHAS